MIQAGAQRVVSLTCSNTEIVAALGCGDRLVGVDDYSDYPEELLEGLPRVGPDLGIDVDQVEALAPDLVLASLTVPGHETVVEEVARRGLPHIAPAPTSVEHVYRDIEQIAELLGVPERGRDLSAALREQLRPLPPPSRRPRIAVQWWPKPAILPGRLSWVTDLVGWAGGIGSLAHEDCESRPVEVDELLSLDPDALVLSWCGVHPDKVRPELLYQNEALAPLRAVRERRIFTIPEAHLGRPSPRLADGFRQLRSVVDACAAS